MLGFKEFIAEDERKQGEILKDIQDLRKRTALLRFKDQYEAERFKLQQQIKRRKNQIGLGKDWDCVD
tara:strand:- start:246 stop:446 length:201 start_codon:yes stop_codon:yes gene_type:complete